MQGQCNCKISKFSLGRIQSNVFVPLLLKNQHHTNSKAQHLLVITIILNLNVIIRMNFIFIISLASPIHFSILPFARRAASTVQGHQVQHI